MTMFNTMHPVPSDATSDFKDNATVLDQLINLAAPSTDSRLGVPLKTWWQIQQDALALISPNVSALAGLTGAADKGMYFTAAGAMSVYDLTAQARTFAAATTQAAQRAALQLVKTTSATDTTAGSMLQVGDGGLLGAAPSLGAVLPTVGGTFILSSAGATAAGLPLAVVHSVTYVPGADGTGGHLFASPMTGVAANRNRLWHAQKSASAITAWEEFAYVGGSPTFATLTLTGPTNNAPAQSIASAATVNLAASTADTVNVTGTVTITGLGNMPVGTRRRLIFAAALTLTNNAAIVIPGGANITTAAGDVAEVESTAASTWRVVNYQKANGQPTVNVSVASGGTGGTTKLSAGTNLGVSVVGTNTTELAQSAMVQAEIANKRAWTAYSPTLVASSGAYTSAAATGEYMVAFGICHWRATVTITTKGTGATPRIGLPFPAKAGMAGVPILARAINVNFKGGAAFIEAGLTTALITAADTTDLGSADGAIIHILGSYPVA